MTLKATLVLLLCSAFFVQSISAGVDEEDVRMADPPEGFGSDEMAVEEMERMDADKDGKVSLKEILTYFRTVLPALAVAWQYAI